MFVLRLIWDFTIPRLRELERLNPKGLAELLEHGIASLHGTSPCRSPRANSGLNPLVKALHAGAVI
jgi:hypothetical protein